ncbi:HNH endonuclease [Chloroflexota bacterium]
MGFSEQVKLEVKRKAAFQCCRCRSIGVQVHHIIPEEHGGSDDISNAAPLCPNCHAHFGGNPDKRKEITQMRDWWYDMVNLQFQGNQNTALFGQITEVHEKIKTIVVNQDKRDLKFQTDFEEIKSTLKLMSEKYIDNMTPGTAVVTASGIINTVSAGTDSNVPMTFRCWKCGRQTDLQYSSICPTCGADNA